MATKPALLAGGKTPRSRRPTRRPVQAHIAAMPGWKRDVGRRLDTLIVRTVPDMRKAVKWSSPFYGIEGQGWFLNFEHGCASVTMVPILARTPSVRKS
jgi:hypothetical protein